MIIKLNLAQILQDELSQNIFQNCMFISMIMNLFCKKNSRDIYLKLYVFKEKIIENECAGLDQEMKMGN